LKTEIRLICSLFVDNSGVRLNKSICHKEINDKYTLCRAISLHIKLLSLSFIPPDKNIAELPVIYCYRIALLVNCGTHISCRQQNFCFWMRFLFVHIEKKPSRGNNYLSAGSTKPFPLCIFALPYCNKLLNMTK